MRFTDRALKMTNRLSLLGGLVVLAFLSLPWLHSNAAEPLPEDHKPYSEYRVIGDRVLLKNPGARVERLPCVYKGHDGLATTWWDDDVRLTYADSSDAHHPSVAIENTYLHVAWRDDRINRRYKVFYKRSRDLGYTWEDDVLISTAPDEVQQSSPDLALSTRCLHAVWGYFIKPVHEPGHIYYRRSIDHGSTWEDVYYLSSYEHQSKPSIAALGDTIYALFTRYIDTRDIYEMHLRKSYDEGVTWTEDRVITDYGPSLIRGTLRANEDGLHYVFNHDDNFEDPNNPYASVEVFYIHSPDFGETWTEPIIVSHRDSIHSQWPSMCVDDQGAVHVTWFDYKFSPYSWTGDIFYTKSSDKSTDDGQFWSDIQVLTDAHTANWSHIIARRNHLYLVWEDQRNEWNNYDVFFRHSPDRGHSWRAEERLTNVRQDSYEPVIAEQDDALYVVWSDKRDDPTNRREEVYFKRGGLEAICLPKALSRENNVILTSHPNPFNEKVVIRYRLAGVQGPRRASLKIYNIRGQLVRVLLDGELVPGEYQAVWDGTESKETKVSSGVYLCLLEVEHDRLLSRLLYLK